MPMQGGRNCNADFVFTYDPATPDDVSCLGNKLSSPNFDSLHRVDVIPQGEQWPGRIFGSVRYNFVR